MKKIFLTLLSFLMIVSLTAQQKVIQLYNGAAPGSENWNWEEKTFFVKNPLNANVAYNISKPTLTVFYPDSVKANSTAVIVCPGGAYHILNFETEGMNVARQLTKKGITAFVFKYRLVQTLTDDPWVEMQTAMKDTASYYRKVSNVRNMARADLNTALIYLRQHATELKIDANRIGVIGFSAGGSLAANMAYNFLPGAKPDFVAPIYSVISAIETRNVKPDAPPLFIAAATDDRLAPVSNSVNLYTDWLNAKRSAELHIYAKGDHGLRGSVASNNWIIRFFEWLVTQKFLQDPD